MKQLFRIRFLMPVVLSALLAGCGGGGSGGGGAAPASSNWDTLTWGQDNWG